MSILSGPFRYGADQNFFLVLVGTDFGAVTSRHSRTYGRGGCAVTDKRPSPPCRGCTAALRFGRPVGRLVPTRGSRRMPPNLTRHRGREPGTHASSGVNPVRRA